MQYPHAVLLQSVPDLNETGEGESKTVNNCQMSKILGGYCRSISVIQQYPLLSGRSQDESQSHDRLWFGKIVDQTKNFPLDLQELI